MTFEFNVSNTALAPVSDISLVRGNENYYRFKFNFLTPDWEGLLQSAIFICGETSARVPIENSECCVPTEIIGGKNANGEINPVYFGIVGYLSAEDAEDTKYAQDIDISENTANADNSQNAKSNKDSTSSQSNFIRISTDLTYIPIQEGAYRKANDASVPSSDIWEKYYTEISLASSYAKDAENFCTKAESLAKDAENSKNSAAQALSDLLSMIGTDIATLIDGKIPASQIPSIATTEIYTAKSQAEMNAITADRGDICIRSDENLSYIYSGGWIALVSPTDYVSRAGHAETASSAENAAKINGHRLVKMTASEFSTAVLDDNTFYLVY